MRHGLDDLGFTDAGPAENIRRIAEVSKLMVEAGLITLVSFISPFVAERQMAREMLGDDAFVEIYVKTPLAEAERRDVKGLYKKARSGELRNFTGIDSPYETPEAPEITVPTMEMRPKPQPIPLSTGYIPIATSDFEGLYEFDRVIIVID